MPPQRPDAVTAAKKFVRKHFPDCSTALLAGSVILGKENAGSDLDIVVIANNDEPNWTTFEEFGWPIEVFVRTPETYQTAFEDEVQHRWPLFITLCKDGTVLLDRNGFAGVLQSKAKRVFDNGPRALTTEEIAWYRYLLTWMIDDVSDADDVAEGYIVAHELAATAAEFLLLYHRQWLGRGKWLIRNLRHTLPLEAAALTQALTTFYQKNDKTLLLQFAESTLELVGGRQFAGHSTNL